MTKLLSKGFVATLLLLAACSGGGKEPAVQEYEGFRFVPLQVQRMPDLPKPRTGHLLLPLGNDGWMVAGGHTTGFIPVAEADFFRDGHWTTVPMLYPHDTPFGLTLRDGRVVIGGGYAENFGIGLSWGVEAYDPATKTFSPLSILDQKRAHASAVELLGGKLAVSGNWCGPDSIESFPTDGSAPSATPLTQTRSYPYVLRSDMDNAIVFGSIDELGRRVTPVVHRFEGEPFEVPLFREWQPFSLINHGPLAEDCFIGDMSTGHFSYLIHVSDSTGRKSAIAKVSGESFSLLQTEHPLPSTGPWGDIWYDEYVHVDREARMAWLSGKDSTHRVYLAGISYAPALDGGAASLTLYYTEPLEDVGRSSNYCLLPGGRMVLAGSIEDSNYEPLGSVYVLSPNPFPSRVKVFPLILALLLASGAGVFLWLRLRRRAKEQPLSAEPPSMAQRIDALMTERQFFRRPDLRLADVARELGTNVTYVSASLNGETGLSFPDYVAGFRVRYAQELLRNYPGKLLSEVAAESGFSSMKSFLRTFKAQTGLTPTQWKEQ